MLVVATALRTLDHFLILVIYITLSSSRKVSLQGDVQDEYNLSLVSKLCDIFSSRDLASSSANQGQSQLPLLFQEYLGLP